MKTKFVLHLFILLLFSQIIFSQNELLQSGPMVGYSEMKEVKIWVQTKKEAQVKIMYFNKENPSKTYFTNTVLTKKEFAFTGHLTADQLEPGNIYEYYLYINDQKVEFDYKTYFKTLSLWAWRSDPPKIKFATGSCAYINESNFDRPGEPYGKGYQIFESIEKKKPEFMIWLGDNLYYREPDWNSRTGLIHRNTHTRSEKTMQKLLATVHNYAIWDDHDYGPNNSDKSFWNKNQTLEMFKLFWANPSYGIGDIKGAITYFNWGDCDFFLLDNRFYRDPNDLKSENKTILGREQLVWIKNSLVSSHATFKFVVMGGQFLTTAKVFETYSNNGFEEERQEIIDHIVKQDIKNVIFITGDRHHSEVSVLKEPGKPIIYDFTTSPLTSGVAGIWEGEINKLRVDRSLINKRNFSLFEITGPKDDRTLHVKFFDIKGKELFNYELKSEKK